MTAKAKTILASALVLALAAGGLFRATRTFVDPVLYGNAMGTTFAVTLPGHVDKGKLQRTYLAIVETLDRVENEMSPWRPESEISRFNRFSETGVPFRVSSPFVAVVRNALRRAKQTDGAFDPTLKPLLDLWGFGSSSALQNGRFRTPTPERIAAAKARTGPEKLVINDADHLSKAIPGLQLDLGAIAKGYGVDAIARRLRERDCENFFVEVGGEVVAQGHNPRGEAWRIGIQYPSLDPNEDRLFGILRLTRGAVATSGDYRNYVRDETGHIRTHILDPRSGMAIHSDLASVSVLADDCMDADAIATALFVMGPEEGMRWTERHPGVEALFLVRSTNGKIRPFFSSGFEKATRYTSIPLKDSSK